MIGNWTKQTWEDGSKYEGEVKQDGTPYGWGIIRYSDRDQYVGQVKDSSPHGKGLYIPASGNMVGGVWNEGEHMEKVCLDPWILVRHDDFSGEGAFAFPSGVTYTGQWSRGLAEGQGKLYLIDGTVIEGFWKMGIYCK